MMILIVTTCNPCGWKSEDGFSGLGIRESFSGLGRSLGLGTCDSGLEGISPGGDICLQVAVWKDVATVPKAVFALCDGQRTWSTFESRVASPESRSDRSPELNRGCDRVKNPFARAATFESRVPSPESRPHRDRRASTGHQNQLSAPRIEGALHG